MYLAMGRSTWNRWFTVLFRILVAILLTLIAMASKLKSDDLHLISSFLLLCKGKLSWTCPCSMSMTRTSSENMFCWMGMVCS